LDSWLLYFAVRVLICVFRILPRPVGVAIIRFLAICTYWLDSRHRHIAAVNLKIAFPDLTDRERRRIALRSFQNTGMNLLEISRMPSLRRDNIESFVTYDSCNGLNNYTAACAKNKGILYLTGHFSAWELLPAAHALHGYPLSFITRPLDNAPLEKYLLRVRESTGNHVINKRNSARPILKNLNSGSTAGILMDHNTSLQEGIFVDFFGIPATTTTSVALFALRTDAPVLPGYLTPMRQGRYTIKFLPPIEVTRTGDMARDLEINTARFNEVLEMIIREQPESWLWGHRRWKNQPPGNPQDLYSLSDEDLAAFLKKSRRAGKSENFSAQEHPAGV
jgi:Kdo2-lipid IVA lauroyltransferase/acyltransferase